LDPELVGLSSAQLQDRINLFQDRYLKISRDRNYMQLEKDMVGRFYEIAKEEGKQLDAEVDAMDKHMQTLQRNHRVEITVHEQTVRRLEYFHKEDRRCADLAGEASLSLEGEDHMERSAEMGREKKELKRDMKEQQLKNEDDVDMIGKGFDKRRLKVRETFEEKERNLEKQYERQVDEVKKDLDLHQRVEMHGTEERTNKHINELMGNHQESFGEVKDYWKEVTKDNLQLVQSLKDSIREGQTQHKDTKQKMQVLEQEIATFATPLEEKLTEQRALENKLKGRDETQAALKNRRPYLKRLDERIETSQNEYRVTEMKYRWSVKARDDNYRSAQKTMRETQRKADLAKNVVLEKKLERLAGQVDDKQAELSDVIGVANLDLGLAAGVTGRIEQVVGAKNRHIRNLVYEAQKASKAYNETIQTYEAKLPPLGVKAEDVAFEKLEASTSRMPAQLVARAR